MSENKPATVPSDQSNFNNVEPDPFFFEPLSVDKELSPKDKYRLAMFLWSTRGFDEAYSIVRDFHVTESLINRYNEKLKEVKQFYEANKGTDCHDLDLLKVAYDYGEQAMDGFNVIVSLLKQGKQVPMLSIEEMGRELQMYLKQEKRFMILCDCDVQLASKPTINDVQLHHDQYKIEQLEHGAVFEKFIAREFARYGHPLNWYNSALAQCCGENEEGVELKYDMRNLDTGNFYIEFAEKSRKTNESLDYLTEKQYTASGILKDDNTKFFVIGVPSQYFIIEKEVLLNMLLEIENEGKWTGPDQSLRMASTETSRGFIIKGQKLKEIAYAESVEDFCKMYYREPISHDYRDDSVAGNGSCPAHGTDKIKKTIDEICARMNLYIPSHDNIR